MLISRKWFYRTALQLAVSLPFSLLYAADAPVDEVATQGFALPGTSARLAYFGNAALDQRHDGVTRVVLFIHGIKRNAGKYFKDVQKMAAHAGVDDKQVLVISPQFLNQLDGGDTQLLHWKREEWVEGGKSLDASHLSSFAALDALLKALSDHEKYPALKQIVIAGHSAGAQFVQRYAILNKQDEALRAAGIDVRYDVANPSSYFYFDGKRPQGDDFVTPTTSCDYQRFKYGPEQLADYALPFNVDEARNRYLKRHVVYLLGGADTDPNHPVLDKSCAAELQGPYRLTRGLSYYRYLFKSPDQAAHILNIIPGVGHDDYAMYNAQCGLAALFSEPCRTEWPAHNVPTQGEQKDGDRSGKND